VTAGGRAATVSEAVSYDKPTLQANNASGEWAGEVNPHPETLNLQP